DAQVELSGGFAGIGAPSPAYHPHGTAMAAFVRQIAPGASLTSYRVLDANGLASVGSVAAAIDRATADLAAGEPTVLNLSLGVPAELSQPADLAFDTCRT